MGEHHQGDFAGGQVWVWSAEHDVVADMGGG
jgi:hypothetical protein